MIAYHHAPEEATIDQELCAIVNLADMFCCVRGLDYDGREWVSFNLFEEQAWQILKSKAPAWCRWMWNVSAMSWTMPSRT